ncbi:Mitochondrial distribution and morphology protein 31, mitochondrial precursor [Maublancomyces gigas]|uniref:Mitochondrial distribution and morphology protein 31, mitochondrial n=1 Tax=Discina gigas TaxID=1032678 RepID=A0ABR3GAG7_9PEZI
MRMAGAAWARSIHSGRTSKPKLLSKTRAASSGAKDRNGSGRGAHSGAAQRLGKRFQRRAVVNINGNDNRTINGNLKVPVPSRSAGEERLLDRVSHIHRPTKDEMLAAATGFFQRLRIRTKWTMIRQMRPYNWDDLSAFFSWLLLGQVLWIVLGTTTFVSLTVLLINTVFAQEYLAGAVGNYLTKETGVKVVFESAIVPSWKDGCITFKNVFVSRRPGQSKQGKKNVSKGSPVTAAAAAAAAAHADEASGKDHHTHTHTDDTEEEDTNYTQFDVTIDAVNVTLSFAKWMNGKGLLEDVEIKGVRGVIDRTYVTWDNGVDPKSFKYEHIPGDFEIDSFKLEDLLVTVHQPDGFRPFSFSIFSCDLPQLRKQWLFYDFLSANMMSGSFDDSLFTIHPRQSHGVSSMMMFSGKGSSGKTRGWKKTSRLRIDGLEIDHLNSGVGGMFSWITDGNVDIVADIMFPTESDLDFSQVVQDIVERMEATVSSNMYGKSLNSEERKAGRKEEEKANEGEKENEKRVEKYIVMDLRIQLNDVRAAVPIFNTELSYINNALIRPMVAYINRRKTYIPINCRVVKRQSEFDGSWTIYDSGLMDDLSAEAYAAFARNVVDDQARRRRFKKVGLWSLQLAAQALLMAMVGNIA